jgi:hypothetical protein
MPPLESVRKVGADVRRLTSSPAKRADFRVFWSLVTSAPTMELEFSDRPEEKFDGVHGVDLFH